MQKDSEITILLTTPEAILFRDFQQFHKTFAILIKSGAFDIQYGKAVMNFAGGELQNVVLEEVKWKK